VRVSSRLSTPLAAGCSALLLSAFRAGRPEPTVYGSGKPNRCLVLVAPGYPHAFVRRLALSHKLGYNGRGTGGLAKEDCAGCFGQVVPRARQIL